MEHLGLEVRRLSHMKSEVSPRVKMKLQQQRQHPPAFSDMRGKVVNSDQTEGELRRREMRCMMKMENQRE